MKIFHRVAHFVRVRVPHFARVCLHAVVRTLTRVFDGLVGIVGRVNDWIEADFLKRTRLLRAYYANPDNRRSAPLPSIDAPIDLTLRGGIPLRAEPNRIGMQSIDARP